MSEQSTAKLTLGMSTYDDYDGVYFTVQAIRLYHPEITDQTEILILDNNPSGPGAAALRQLAEKAARCRYVPNEERVGTAVRDLIFREARSPYVLCMDSHVLFVAGALRRLIDYLDAHPACRDLLQGPILWDELTVGSTHFEPKWSAGMYGVWANDPRGDDPDGEPFEIPMHGLGVFACRKDAWLGFNPRLSGFGSEEGYVHEKFRRAGRRTLCLPFLRWLHRFQRPLGIPYRNDWQDRVRNYFIGLDELGVETEAMVAHFRDLIGAATVEPIVDRIRAEVASPFFYFDAIYCVGDGSDHDTEKSTASVRHGTRIYGLRRFQTIGNEHPAAVREALTHRAIIERARVESLASVLVLDPGVTFVDDACARLAASLSDLRSHPWPILDLGAAAAVAYSERAYERLLDGLPADPEAMTRFLAIQGSLASYLASFPGRLESRLAIVRRANAIERALGDDALKRPRPRAELLAEVLDGEVLLYDRERGAAIRLNESAALVWGLCDGQRTVADIAAGLVDAFSTARTIVGDVGEVVRSLADRGVVDL